MSTSSTTATPAASPTLATPGLPPVECADWCAYGDGNGHAGARHVEDQACMSRSDRVDLTAMRLVGEYPDNYRDNLRAYLLREAYSTRTTVELVHDEMRIGSLTGSEAIALGELLIRHGEQAEATR